MAIRQLPPNLVNRIAAGEVVERPASVVKELVENAVDAGACRIDIATSGGGLRLIRVTDDGSGMGADDLALAVERHATSKLADDDLSTILTLGFRGEALPSIGAVGRLSIQSRAEGATEAYEIAVDAGRKAKLKPAALAAGTRVEVRDLFYATPARLKFMKSERVEAAAIADMVKRLALARPEIAFSLTSEDRTAFRLEACPPGLIDHGLARLGRILGPDFVKDALPVRAQRGSVVAGRLRRPSHAASAEQPPALSHRQWPPGARQAARRHGARRLRRSRAARPLPPAGPVLDAAARRGGRERPSRQDRAEIPRSERHPLAHHRRAQGHAWRRGSPRYRVPVASSPGAHGAAEPRRNVVSPGPTAARRQSRIRLRRDRASAARSAFRAERRHARPPRADDASSDSLSARRRPRADQRHLHHRRDRGCAGHRRSARRA